jgi:energy-coupling factor transport system permease protein
MDTRGYGRSGTASQRERRATGTLMLAGLVGLCFGVYGLLDQTSSLGTWGTRAAVTSGLAACVAGMWLAGRRVERTFYRPDPWRAPETIVALSGLAAAAVGWWVRSRDVLLAYPDVSGSPHITTLALGGVLLGLVPALAAPEPKVVVAT